MTGWTSIGRAGPRTAVAFCLRRHEPDGSHIWQYLLDVRQSRRTARRLTDRKDPEYNGAFSPDGTRVLFVGDHALGDAGQPRYRRHQRRRHGA